MAVRPSVAEASPFETVVADVLRGTASEAKASYNEFASPWGLSFPAGICAGFHLVLEGQCWVRMADLAPVCASAGDVVLLPHGDGHTLSDRPDRPPTPFDPARHTNARQRGGGEQATLLCGVYRFGGSGQPNPIRPLLPALIH
ncbi:MAG: cupin domain-containing protein, partial [Polyangiaceae bacterium]|nr:cupin domain-containing protein [Polyangiaceae bacterium]